MSIERELQRNYQEVFYPPVSDLEPEVQPQQEPAMQLAEVGATKMADYGYSGERQATMTDFEPTMRERIADFLQAGFERLGVDRYKARQNAQTLIGGPSSNLPLQAGIADIIPLLGTALQTEEAARLSGQSVESAKRGEYGTAAMQAGFGAVGMIPGAVGTAQVIKKLPKNLPVGMSTEAVGGIESALQPAKATAPASDIGFFSAVEQAALNIKRNSGTGQAMLNDITKGENVKADEIKWIGLDDFLKGKKNVTKQEVQDFIANNKVDVQEVTLGAPTEAPEIAAKRERFQQLSDKMEREDGLLPPDMAEMDKLQQELSALPNPWLSNKEPRFGAYTLPGGDNYREILLTMPNKEPAMPKGYEVTSVQYDDGTSRYFAETPTTRSAAYKTEEDAKAELQRMVTGLKEFRENLDSFKSSHFDQPNILAHIRVNDRVDADGKKMLLVEEVQSDWHQAGRDKGYKGSGPTELPSNLEVVEDQYANNPARKFIVRDKETGLHSGWSGATPEQARDTWLAAEKRKTDKPDAVPDAPMKDTWYQLALKRVLKYAADNGYERVGLTTGKQQVERFDLSKQVDAVSYHPDDRGRGMMLNVFGKNNEVIYSKLTPEDKVSDVIGKEAAKKLLSQNPVNDNRVLEGLDLQVGGEGMKKYYDEIYPQFLAKYGKKWDAKVGQTTIEAEGKEPVRYIDITPEMRQSVSKGQPLFSATGIATGAGAGTMATSQQEPQ
jgi:hypothetical protein